MTKHLAPLKKKKENCIIITARSNHGPLFLVHLAGARYSINTRWREESDDKNRNGSRHRRRTSPGSRDGDFPRGTQNQYRRRVESGSKGEHRARDPRWASVAASGKSLNPSVSNPPLSNPPFILGGGFAMSFSFPYFRFSFPLPFSRFLSLPLFFSLAFLSSLK